MLLGRCRLALVVLGAAHLTEVLPAQVHEDATFFATDGAFDDQFGKSVSVCGDRALAGAPFEDHAGQSYVGAAYVFERDATGTWNQVAKLRSNDGSTGDRIGWSVCLSGDRAFVGAPYEDEHGVRAGAVYLFERQTSGSWVQVAKIVAGDPQMDADFGIPVAAFGERVLVGASRIYPHPAAYLYERDAVNGSWNQIAKLTGLDVANQSKFGDAVSLVGDRALVGCPDDNPNSVVDAGSAFLFEPDSGGNWLEVVKLVASDGESADRFGAALELFGDRALIGSLGDDDLGSNTGAAHVFDVGLGETYCHSTPNSTGSAAMLAAVGSNSVAANELALTAAPVPKIASGIFFLGPTKVNQAFGNGIRCAGGSIVRLAPTIARHHVLAQRLDLAAPPLSGAIVPASTWNSQAWFRDVPARGAYFNTSSAISILFEP